MKELYRRRLLRSEFKRLVLFFRKRVLIGNRIFDRNPCDTLFQFVYS